MNTQQRKNLAADLNIIRGTTLNLPNPVLAEQRMRTWAALALPGRDDERGGSSSPVEISERLEDRRVAVRALSDLGVIGLLKEGYEQECRLTPYAGITPEFCKAAELYAGVLRRYVIPVDHDRLPDDPGCRSCARPGKVGKRQFQGHPGVPVYEKAKKHGLCRWCYDAFQAEGELPPVDVIDLYHRVSARAAGIELAKRTKTKERV